VQLAFDPTFDPFIERAERIEVAGVSIPVVTRPDLITMKAQAARDPARRRSKVLRDLADIELLSEEAHDPDEGW
jgi:predicted nucleotidyltransferase